MISFTRAQLRLWNGECRARQQRIDHLLGVIAAKDKQIRDLEQQLARAGTTAQPGEVETHARVAYSEARTPEEPSYGGA